MAQNCHSFKGITVQNRLQGKDCTVELVLKRQEVTLGKRLQNLSGDLEETDQCETFSQPYPVYSQGDRPKTPASCCHPFPGALMGSLNQMSSVPTPTVIGLQILLLHSFGLKHPGIRPASLAPFYLGYLGIKDFFPTSPPEIASLRRSPLYTHLAFIHLFGHQLSLCIE